VEAEPMPRRRNEAVIGGVYRRREHGAKALLGRVSVGGEELEFVEALLVEQDGALRAEDLQRDAALAAPGRAVERQGARDATGELEQHAGDVESFDGATATFA